MVQGPLPVDAEFKSKFRSRLAKNRKLISFKVLLPFQVPFPDHVAVTATLADNSFLSVSFEVVEDEETRANSSPMKVTRSLAFLVITTRRDSVGESDLSDLFDVCLEYLNDFLRTYVLVTKDAEIYPVSLPMFLLPALWVVRDVSDDMGLDDLYLKSWKERPDGAEMGVLLLNWNFPYRKPIPPDETLDRVVGLLVATHAEDNPFLLGEELTMAAERHVRVGSYRMAVLEEETSFEVFANTLLRLLLLGEGNTPIQIASVLEKHRSFVGRLKSFFSDRIGGDFRTAGSGEIAVWHSDVYKLRNSVIHEGSPVSRVQAEQALRASRRAKVYVLGLLESRPDKFGWILRYAHTKAETGEKAS